jgi:hypothetical protein
MLRAMAARTEIQLASSRPTGTPPPPEPDGSVSPAWDDVVRTQVEGAFARQRREATINACVRILLYGLAVFAYGGVITWAVGRSDVIVDTLADGNPATRLDLDDLVAIVLPAGLGLLLGTMALVAAVVIQRRGVEDFERGFEAAIRIWREAQAGVFRNRLSAQLLDEYLANARRALSLQLWLDRSLFIVALTLFACAVGRATFEGIDPWTASLGAGSLLTLVGKMVSGAGDEVGGHLADATQIHVAVAGTTRQLNVTEEYLNKLVFTAQADPDQMRDAVLAGVREMAATTERAVQLIQGFAEPPGESREQDTKLRRDAGVDADASHRGPAAFSPA